ncbi:hypothetical protein [Niallia circulans]|uniref:hypothetical protein n=1 Tax=Niallia circulans TaxID=1397 RepID=UPI00300A1EEF
MRSNQIRIFLATDSTIQKLEDNNYQGGLGEFLQDYFTKNVQIMNHAIGGKSSKTFGEEDRLKRITEDMGAETI